MSEIRCELGCGDPIDPDGSRVCQWTSGWAEKRKQGGANAIRLPVREQRFAHLDCVEDEARGKSVRQTWLM